MLSLRATSQEHHAKLLPHVDRLLDLAEMIGRVECSKIHDVYRAEYGFIVGQLVPHMDAVESTLYERLERLMGKRHSMAPMREEHAVMRQLIDELRRRKRQSHLSLDAPVHDEAGDRRHDAPDPAPGPEQVALRGEVRRALEIELRRLPDDQRLAVVLRDVEGLSYEEIAASMGSSTGTVKSRISRGRARLREALRARPELFGDLIRPTGEGQVSA